VKLKLWEIGWYLPDRMRKWLYRRLGEGYATPEDYEGHYCRDCAGKHP
jgi:hypothetical protein